MSTETRPSRALSAHRSGCALAFAVAVLTLFPRAWGAGGAQQAAREFDRGTAAAARGDYLDAAAAFMRAYKLAPHAAPLYNAALAWEASGDRPRAADAYARALDMGGLGDGQGRDARRRLEALETRLGLVELTAAEGTTISIGHVERVEVPARVHLERGDHALRAWFPDGRTLLKQVAVGSSPQSIRLDPEAPVLPPPPAAASSSSAVGVVPDRGSALRTAGWVAIGLGVAGGGVTGVLGYKALQARDEYNDSGHTDRGAYDRASSLRTWTNVALAASVTAGAVGLVLVLKSPSGPAGQAGPSGPAPRLWLSAHAAGASFGGTF